MENNLSSSGVLWPCVAFDQDLAVRRHARFRVAGWISDYKFDPDDLLHAVVAKVSILWSKRSFRVDARDHGVDRTFRIRIEVDTRCLAQLNASNVTLGNKAAQIDLTEIEHRNDRSSGRHNLAGFSRARRNRAVERRDDSKINAIGLRLFDLRIRTFCISLRRGYIGLRLRNLLLSRGGLR